MGLRIGMGATDSVMRRSFTERAHPVRDKAADKDGAPQFGKVGRKKEKPRREGEAFSFFYPKFRIPKLAANHANFVCVSSAVSALLSGTITLDLRLPSWQNRRTARFGGNAGAGDSAPSLRGSRQLESSPPR